ncbi:hypothetical protein [Peribacillus frigoritolerans]|uniref:hypothetical protein n=1 Tax=Peribacillus frigoritolerans TaxID=450367 RepID=UPI0023DBD260|nr:hypothetical protein [Peribacillus frigoritolerans]MDF1998863.1 hypothetical protein [Peribacillus frigoritolerans]
MKKFAIVPLVAVLSFSILWGNKSEAAIDNKPGDIIVTNSTSGSGILGHSGIYIDTTHILQTSGWKSEPYPKVLSESQWHGRYAHSKVVRSNSSTIGYNAAQKAKYYFQGKTIPYKVTEGPTNISNTYCSELVWYSYYKAGKTFKTHNSSGSFYQPTSLITPYNFIDRANVDYNNFKFIDNNW